MEVLVFVIGLCFGSFINMLVWRTINEKELTKYVIARTPPLRGTKQSRRDRHAALAMTLSGRSFCDYCGKRLNWWNNVPVLSFLLQKGKSQCCGKKLDISYPIVEIIMGILFLLNFKLPFTNYYLLLTSYCIIILVVYSAVYDAKTMYLPDWSTWALIFLAIIYQIIGRPAGPPMLYLLNIVYSAMGASLFLYLLSLVKIRGQSGMGMGDVFLAIFMGLLLGYPNIIVAFYVAFIIGAVFGIVYLWVFKGKNKSTMIPFGPFLLLGTLVAWWWGEGLWYYFSNLVIR